METAEALYDFKATQPDDLPFRRGDTLQVIIVVYRNNFRIIVPWKCVIVRIFRAVVACPSRNHFLVHDISS